MVLLLYNEKEYQSLVEWWIVAAGLLFRQEEVNLEKWWWYVLLYYQLCKFRFKSSCSIAFLRSVELQESVEATASFMPLKS